MRAIGVLLLSLSAIALAGGCGGSSSSSSTNRASPAPAGSGVGSGASSNPAGGSSGPAGGSSGSAGGSSGSAGGSTRPGATLNTITPPKYASPPPGSPVRSGVVQIAYRNITIQPDAIRVRVGSTLRWTNFDTVQHTVTSRGGPQSFASGKLSPGSSFHIRVQRPGTIHYLCTIHPVTMNGTIEVVR